MVRPDYIFGEFRETARCRDAQHGDGVGCASHHSLFFSLPLAVTVKGYYFQHCLFVFVCLCERDKS